jgi:hypothetical protein
MMPMNSRITRLAYVLTLFSVALAGCADNKATRTPADDAPSQGQSSSPAGMDAAQRRAFDDRLLEIATSYESYGRSDTAARWAPADCRPPAAPEFAFSRSTDPETHGRKLYSLFAKHRGPWGSYVEAGQGSQVGQVIVKESWVPEEVKDDGGPLEPVRRKVKVRQGDALVEQEDSFVPYARRGGRLYRAREKGPLFVMFKTDPQTPGTDEGWVYGTVTPDGQRVTSVGWAESCMKCHREAPHDRLFGLPDKE